jgi:hypothetical protein
MPLRPEQDWCLRCGAAARTRLAAAPNWKAPVAVFAAVIAICLGVLAAALVKLAGGSGTPVTLTRTVTNVAVAPPAAAAPAPAPATTAPTPGQTAGAAGARPTTSTPAAPSRTRTTVPAVPRTAGGTSSFLSGSKISTTVGKGTAPPLSGVGGLLAKRLHQQREAGK